MWMDQLMAAAAKQARNTGALSRRGFAKITGGGSVGLAFVPLALPLAQAQSQARGKVVEPAPGQKPTERPGAFVTIARDGTSTIVCNRLDMGQGIETALAMICADELDADWRAVRTGFGDAQAAYVDPMIGMHLTGGSNSVMNRYIQYRELGARTRAMLVAAAAKELGVPAAHLMVANGRISGAGRSLGYGELFEAAMREPIPQAVTLKDPKAFKLIGKPTGLKPGKGPTHFAVPNRERN